jgi:hypothetical protein
MKNIINRIQDKEIKNLLSKQSERVNHAIKSLMVWHDSKERKFPALVIGSSGSSKSYITSKLFQGILGEKNVIHTIPPSEGSYSDHIENQIARPFDLLIIDEAHKFHFDVETIQPHTQGLTIGETFVRYDQLIFISHAGLGKNTSEDARLQVVEYGTPTREEIISLLVEHEGFPKNKATWSAWHSPKNMHNAVSVSIKFGTDLQETVNPCGLTNTDLDILKYYRDSEKIGANTISSCSGKLSLDVNAVKNSERRLKAESLLIVGKQSRREVSCDGMDLLYTMEENSNPEPEKPTQSKPAKKETAKKSPNKRKPAPKSPSKKATSKAKKTAKVSLDDIKSEIEAPVSPLDSYPSTKD